jgi:hypothetical protein
MENSYSIQIRIKYRFSYQLLDNRDFLTYKVLRYNNSEENYEKTPHQCRNIESFPVKL